MTLRGIGTGNPGGAGNHARVGINLHVVSVEGTRANVALDQEVALLEILIAGELELGRFKRSLQALFIQRAVARNKNSREFPFLLFLRSCRGGYLDHHTLEGVRCGDLAVGDSNAGALSPLHQRFDGLGFRSLMLLCLRQAVEGDFLWSLSDHGLHVGGVIALGGPHEGIFAYLRHGEELLRGRATHRARGGLTNRVINL